MTDNYLEETQLVSENTNDHLENIANLEMLYKSSKDEVNKELENLSITEKLSHSINFVSSVFSSANEWLKENDPFSLPVVEASVWDALGKDHDFSREHNYGRDSSDRADKGGGGEKYSAKMKDTFSNTGSKPFNNIKDSPRNSVYADNTGHRTFSSTSQDGNDEVILDHNKNYNSVKITHTTESWGKVSGSVGITKNGDAQAKLEYKREF